MDVNGYSVEKMRTVDRPEVVAFLEYNGLTMESSIDYTAVMWHEGQLVGTCSFEGCTLKSFAVKACYQGVGASSIILTHMLNTLFDRGHYTAMAYIKSDNRVIFEGMQFTCVYDSGQVALMQMGIHSLEQYLESLKIKLGPSKGIRSSIVMNGNPFTKGHAYLIEKAASESDELIVFVVQEDKSKFPFDVRLNLIEAGTQHLDNVTVVPGGAFVVSMNTFPEYFEKKANQKAKFSADLDAGIFCEKIAPMLEIQTRYVGTEPLCALTTIYNESLQDGFQRMKLNLKIVQRNKVEDHIVSASYVRKCISEGDWDHVKKFVPRSTYTYLRSEESQIIIDDLKQGGGGVH